MGAPLGKAWDRAMRQTLRKIANPLRLVGIFLVVTLLAAACGSSSGKSGQSGGGSPVSHVKIGLVLSGPIGNNPFLAAIKTGFFKAAKKFGYQAAYVESSDTSAIATNVETYASEGYKLVIANSFESVQGLQKVAKQFPNTKFGIVDSTAKGSNIRSVIFKEYQATFLVGYEMANLSKSHVIGFVGAYKIPLVSKWYGGIQQGLAYAQRTEGIKTRMIELFTNSFTDTATTKQLALQEIHQGADFIMPAAGAGEFGGYSACAAKHVWCEAVDNDYRSLNSYIIDGELKRTDVGTYDIVAAFHAGASPWATTTRLGIAQRGVGLDSVVYPKAKTTRELGAKLYAQLKKLSQMIASGQVVVKDPCGTC